MKILLDGASDFAALFASEQTGISFRNGRIQCRPRSGKVQFCIKKSKNKRIFSNLYWESDHLVATLILPNNCWAKRSKNREAKLHVNIFLTRSFSSRFLLRFAQGQLTAHWLIERKPYRKLVLPRGQELQRAKILLGLFIAYQTCSGLCFARNCPLNSPAIFIIVKSSWLNRICSRFRSEQPVVYQFFV